jgi:hypothetical protein
MFDMTESSPGVNYQGCYGGLCALAKKTQLQGEVGDKRRNGEGALAHESYLPLKPTNNQTDQQHFLTGNMN